MKAASDAVELSIVVAADEAGRGLPRCLEALRPQVRSSQTEVIVAVGSPRGWDEGNDLGWLRVVRLAPGTGVPHLWSAGIDAAKGRIVALTIEQCVPAGDWAESIVRAHSAGHAAIGGAIAASAGLGLAEWAIYFSRYTRYMPPATPEFLEDLAGDNCSYQRAAIAELVEVRTAGFWETFVHRALREGGQQLFFDPSVVVTYAGPIFFWRFFRRRFAHARIFAARRGREMAAGPRLARVAASPLVPLVMLRRIASCVWKRPEHRGRFLACLPHLLALLVSWAAGEGAGYLLSEDKKDSSADEPGRSGSLR